MLRTQKIMLALVGRESLDQVSCQLSDYRNRKISVTERQRE